MRNHRYFIILFLLVCCTDILGIALNIPILHTIAKPLLMPVLIGWLYSSGTIPAKGLVLCGLFFSWLGDIALLLEDRHALLFIAGLICFLITHICYIIYFGKLAAANTAPSLLRRMPWLALLVTAYGISLVAFLYPKLGDLRLPVIVYAAVICTMLLFSIHVFNKVNRTSGLLYTGGALFFVLSDSLLAINKFYAAFTGAGVAIMLTYCAAQFCIVQGTILLAKPGK